MTSKKTSSKKTSKPIDVGGYEFAKGPGKDAPVLDEGFIFRDDFLQSAAYAVANNIPLLIVGHKGFGKTAAVRNLAAKCGHALTRINLNGNTTVRTLKGGETVGPDRTIVFRPGPVVEAIEEGHWLLLDEFDAASPAVNYLFQPLLEEGGSIYIEEENRYAVRHPNFRVFACANTLGVLAESRHSYAGAQRQNQATLDRFGWWHLYGEPELKDESKIVLARYPKLKGSTKAMKDGAILASVICRVARKLRSLYEQGRFSDPVGTRTVLEWAKAAGTSGSWGHLSPIEAAEGTLLRRLQPHDRAVAEEVLVEFFGTKAASEKKGGGA